MAGKVLRVLFFVFLGVLFLEAFLRLGGFAYSRNQERHIGQAEAGTRKTFTVLALGESTTAGRYNWPYLAEEILNNKYNDIDIKFINKGINDTRSGILVAKARDYIDKYEPDVIVSMMGANDAFYKGKYYNIEYKEENEWNRIWVFLKNNSRVYKFVDLLLDPSLKEQEENINKYGGRKSTLDYLSEIVSSGKVEEGIEKCREILESDPNNAKIWTILGWLTTPNYSHYGLSAQEYKEWVDKNEEAVKYFKKAIKINPRYYNAYYGIADNDPYQRSTVFSSLAERRKATEQAISIAEQALRYYPDDQYLYSYLIRKKLDLYKIDHKNGEKFKVEGFEFSEGRTPQPEITRKNYNKLYDIAKEEGVKLVAMQYPTRDIAELKNYFNPERQQDIIFVSNESNFNKALQKHDYQDIFQDRCYDNFGHGTQMGRGLIAEELASVLEREFNFN
jgi:tetratricopeptide (TPR) repeat protein